MLKRVEFENYKAIQDGGIDLARFTVIIGPNGCGKTSTLSAIHSMIKYLQEKGDFNLMLPTNKRLADNSMSGKLVDGEETEFEFSSRQNNGSYDISVKNKDNKHAIFSKTIFFAPQINDIFSPVPLQLKPSISATGFGVADVLADLSMNRRDLFSDIENDLKKIVANLSAIHISRTQIQTGFGHSISLKMVGVGLLPASRLSEGTLISLALLTLLHSPERPGLILMDDIDRALHPKAQAELIGCIRAILDANPDLQILCTTHSPYLLDQFRFEEVRVMAIGADGLTRCRGLMDHPRAAEFKDRMGAGEFWAMAGEDWVLALDEAPGVSGEAPGVSGEAPPVGSDGA